MTGKQFLQQGDKTITVNGNSLKSIKQAEIQKAILENAGFSLVDTTPCGFDKFILTYEKSVKDDK